MKYTIIDNNKIIDYVNSDQSYYNRLVEIFNQYEVIPIGENEMSQIASIGEYYVNGQYLRFMKIAQLTIEQYRQLFGQSVNGIRTFSVAVTPDALLCIPEDDVNDCTNPNFPWVSGLTIQDYSIIIPSTTPPTMTGTGVLLPIEVEVLELFPNNQFNLNGYVVTLTDTPSGLAVDVAYLLWEGFRQEQDNGINITINETFNNLWYILLDKYQNGDTIPL
jgi:hypothetical protein